METTSKKLKLYQCIDSNDDENWVIWVVAYTRWKAKQIACGEFYDADYISVRTKVWKKWLKYINMESERVITCDEWLRCEIYYHTDHTEQGCEQCWCQSNSGWFYYDNWTVLCRNCYDNDTED